MAEDTTNTETAEAEEVVEIDEAREELLGRITDALGDAVVDSHIVPGRDLWIRVRTEAWAETAEVLRNRLQARYFGFLSLIDWMPSPYGRSMTAEVDRELAGETYDLSGDSGPYETGYAGGETRFQAFARVAHVGTPGAFWGVTLKADIPDEPFEIATWTNSYAGADWHEREAWEMFGVNFIGHPGLRHMYLPTGFQGHPLRKDFPLVARQVKPWPGIVDVEPMPTEDEPADDQNADAEGAASGSDDTGEGGES